jgi:hypothetical protein
MITTISKNSSLVCGENLGIDRLMSCQECTEPVEQQVSPLKRFLGDLWLNIRLFVGTDRWGRDVTLKVGDSHYTMRMDEMEARWRNR